MTAKRAYTLVEVLIKIVDTRDADKVKGCDRRFIGLVQGGVFRESRSL